MTGNTLDFDQFWANRETTPLQFTALGELVTVNTEIPLRDMQAMGNVDLDNTNAVQTIAVTLFSQETYDRWLEKGLLFPQLTLLVMWALLRIQGSELSFEQVAASLSTVMGKALTSLGATGEPSKPDSPSTTGLTTAE